MSYIKPFIAVAVLIVFGSVMFMFMSPATIEIELEQLEGKLSKGEAVDLDGYTRAAGHLRRILESLGLERKQRDVTPSVAEYVESLAEEDAA